MDPPSPPRTSHPRPYVLLDGHRAAESRRADMGPPSPPRPSRRRPYDLIDGHRAAESRRADMGPPSPPRPSRRRPYDLIDDHRATEPRRVDMAPPSPPRPSRRRRLIDDHRAAEPRRDVMGPPSPPPPSCRRLIDDQQPPAARCRLYFPGDRSQASLGSTPPLRRRALFLAEPAAAASASSPSPPPTRAGGTASGDRRMPLASSRISSDLPTPQPPSHPKALIKRMTDERARPIKRQRATEASHRPITREQVNRSHDPPNSTPPLIRRSRPLIERLMDERRGAQKHRVANEEYSYLQNAIEIDPAIARAAASLIQPSHRPVARNERCSQASAGSPHPPLCSRASAARGVSSSLPPAQSSNSQGRRARGFSSVFPVRGPVNDSAHASQIPRPLPRQGNSATRGMDIPQWDGPGLHGFHSKGQLLRSTENLNRFLTRPEAFCILKNAPHFERRGLIYDAIHDPHRPDFWYVVVSRQTFLSMGILARAEGRYWPGYKEQYHRLSKERRISTLKVTEKTFIWRHEVSGKRLLRRRISTEIEDLLQTHLESTTYYSIKSSPGLRRQRRRIS
ncbi:hypothetical protein ACP70R_014398 [Stipagrostis hirtigluma subsp. patula]